MQSRRDNDLAARFPEIVRAGRGLGDVVLDGELVALRESRLDFGALTSSPNKRAEMGVTVYYIAFDLLAEVERDWRRKSLQRRRARLEELFVEVAPPLQLIPQTTDQEDALVWMERSNALLGIEGVVVKARDQRYRAGRTGDWRKIRQKVIVDAVVVGVAGPLARPEAVVLARPDSTGMLQHIGLSLPLSPALRTTTATLVTPTDTKPRPLTGTFLGQPSTDYQPVHPTLVVEIEAEATVLIGGGRLRPRVHRLRPDLTANDIAP